MKIKPHQFLFLIMILLIATASCRKKVADDTFISGIIVDSTTNEPLTGADVSIFYKSQGFFLNNKFLLDSKVSDERGNFSLSFNSSKIFRDYIFEIKIENSEDYSPYQIDLPPDALIGKQNSMDTIRLKRMTQLVVRYENKMAPANIEDQISFNMGSKLGNYGTGFTDFHGTGETIFYVEPKKMYYFRYDIKKANGYQFSKTDSSEFIWKKRNEYRIEY